MVRLSQSRNVCKVVLAISMIFCVGCNDKKAHTVAPTATTKSESGSESGREIERARVELVRASVNELTKGNWTDDAANTVVDFNIHYLTNLKSNLPEEYEIQIKTWSRLGEYPEVMRLLSRHPEVAGLLCMAGNPRNVCKSLSNPSTFQTAVAIYATPGCNIDSMSIALNRHGNTICWLHEDRLFGYEAAFVFPRDDSNPSIEEYDLWLEHEFRNLEGDIERKIEFCQLLMFQGKAIRRMFLEDAEIAKKFESQIWPKFQYAVQAGYLSAGLSSLDTNILRLLSQDRGEAMIKKMGNLSTLFFFGDDRLPEPVHNVLAKVLLIGNNQTVAGIFATRENPQLFKLLLRDDLSVELKAAAVSKLSENIREADRFVTQYAGLSPTALEDEVGPEPTGVITWLPLYDTYHVSRKLLQGRDVSALEFACVALDAVDVAATVTTLGSSKIVTIAGKGGAKAVLKSTSKELGEEAVERAIKRVSKMAAKELGNEVVEEASEKLLPWAIRDYQSRARAALVKEFGKRTTLDMTTIVQSSFKNFGLKLNDYKKITGLDARIFMRGDRVVLVKLDSLLVVAKAVTSEIAINAGIEYAMDTEGGKRVAQWAVASAMQLQKIADNDHEVSSVDSRHNLATWWNAQSTGILDRATVSETTQE